MKKLLAVLMVLAFAVTPAMADDALDASGSMRVEGYTEENANFLGDKENEDRAYWDQRFRLQIRMKPADGVSATVRTDIAEDIWGNTDGAPFNRPVPGNGEIMIDRAYLTIEKGMFTINGGLRDYNLGMGHAYNNQGQGLQISANFAPITATVGFSKESERGSRSDEESILTDDLDNYWLNLGYSNDMLSGNLFYAWADDGNDSDFDPNVLGVNIVTKVGPVSIKGELDIFGGDISDDVEATGVQFYGDVYMMLSDTLKIGADLVYSDDNDESDEAKLTAVNKFGDYVYQDKHSLSPGNFQSQVLGVSGDIFDLIPDAWVSAVPSLAGQSTGSIGVGPYVEFKAMDDLTLVANFFWLTASDDLDTVDGALIYGAKAVWAFAPKTKLEVAYHAVSLDTESDFEDAADAAGVPWEDDFSAFGAVLTVSF